MKNKKGKLVALTTVLIVVTVIADVRADSESNREYQIKAAFLYNFINFVDWPKEKKDDSNEPIIIGIIGKDPFGNAFELLGDKKVKDRDVVIKRFKGLEELEKAGEKDKAGLDKQIEDIRKSHLLFICSSEGKNLGKILNLVKGHSVLTVGEMSRFLEAGGIINLLHEGNRIRFEINAAAAKKADLKVRSKLLRLAKRVIEE